MCCKLMMRSLQVKFHNAFTIYILSFLVILICVLSLSRNSDSSAQLLLPLYSPQADYVLVQRWLQNGINIWDSHKILKSRVAYCSSLVICTERSARNWLHFPKPLSLRFPENWTTHCLKHLSQLIIVFSHGKKWFLDQMSLQSMPKQATF